MEVLKVQNRKKRGVQKIDGYDDIFMNPSCKNLFSQCLYKPDVNSLGKYATVDFRAVLTLNP